MSDALTVAARSPWWAEAVHAGRWSGRDVVAWLGPELVDPFAPARLRERVTPWVGRRSPGLLPLLAFVVTEQRRPAWIYEPPDGVSATILAASERDGLPAKAALELVSQVAAAVYALGLDAVVHPGPSPHHVLVSSAGTVAVSHAAGPGPRTASAREPHGREDDSAVVWRLGVLLAEVLTGQPPPAVTDPTSAEASERRLSVRLLARPGSPLPPDVRTWLGALLAYDALDRPPLARIGDLLAELAEQAPGASLEAFCRDRVPLLRSRPPPVEPVAASDTGEIERRPEPTEETVMGQGDLADDDDTQLSADAESSLLRRRSEPGAIPVQIGPPVEVMRRMRPSHEVFRGSPSLSSEPTDIQVRYRPLIAAAITGMALAAVFTAWLLWWA